MAQRVYKIISQADWQAMQAAGHLGLAGDDARDGYIHLSAAEQLAGTLAKHYAGQTDLVLLAFDAATLGDDLRWEVSRGGASFPHFYAPLDVAWVVQALALESRNGDTYLPDDWPIEGTA
jgi:uncharacterized protein (DUF952 family)